jgi:hypothetical protein
MKNALLMLLAAPLGYLLVSGYLLAKIRPLPIAFMPQSGADEREAALAA